MVATFDAAVPDDATITVTKNNTEISGKVTKDEAKTSVTFTADANFTAGTYTLTATLGDAKTSKEVNVKDAEVTTIELLNTTALTGKESTEAYIYYDVKDQYGNSMRTSENIEWTIAPDSKTVDKATGKITVTKSDGFTYGSQIYVTGVHVKSGKSYTGSVTVGMAQAVDSVKFAGFISKDNKTKKLEILPNDFAKNTYYLLYQTFDQNGNPLDVTEKEFTSDNLTFVCDSPLIATLDTKTTAEFTVDGETYAAIAVEPGKYVDKGGEINISAISNKTGKKTTQNYVIGENALLQSLVLTSPVNVVADGDSKVKIPYVAKDTKGNEITNYETIVRSTNTLQLSASDETSLVVKEENDGTAGIYWSDASKYNPKDENTYTQADVCNDQNRKISLTTVVVGGESNTMMLEVSDIRRPNAIKSIKLNDDNNNSIADGNKAELWLGNFTFVDQYGVELDGDKAKAFFKCTAITPFGKSSDSGYYGIKVTTTGKDNNEHLGLSDKVYYYGKIDLNKDGKADQEQAYGHWDSNAQKWVEDKYSVRDSENLAIPVVAQIKDGKVATDTVKFSIAKITKDKGNNAAGEKFKLDGASFSDKSASDMTLWSDVSKIKSVTYTIVPVKSLKNYSISGLDDRLEIETDGLKDGAKAKDKINDQLSVKYNRWTGYGVMKVQGTYDGNVITIPNTAYNYSVASGSAFVCVPNKISNPAMESGAVGDSAPINSEIDGLEKLYVTAVSGGALTYGDLYDFNTYANPRKDAKLDIKVTVNVNKEPITKTVTVSDEPAKITSVKFRMNYNDGIQDATLNPTLTDLTSPIVPISDSDWANPDKLLVYAYSQYGQPYYTEMEFKVSDVKESDGNLAHKLNNFVVNKNSTTSANIEGAEIGDTFTLTAKAKGTDVTDSIKITVGADEAAYIDQNGDGTKASSDKEGNPILGTKDKGLRELLDYDR